MLDQRPVVLLAEDNALIGIDLRDALDEAGYRVAGPYRTLADAMIRVRQDPPDLAVLDLMLVDGACEDLAQELRCRGVPFLVYSGRHPGEALARAFQGVPWFDKPASLADIVAALAALARAPARPLSFAR